MAARIHVRMLISLGLSAVLGTLWATYNGVTEFVDRRFGRRQLNSIWFGQDYDIKAWAFPLHGCAGRD